MNDINVVMSGPHLTPKGRRTVAFAVILLFAFGAGITAQYWNPWSKSLSSCEIVKYGDGSGVRYCGNEESGTYPEGTFR